MRPVSLRLAAHYACKRANRADLRSCTAGLDSAAVLVQRADKRVRKLARTANLFRRADPASGGIALLRFPSFVRRSHGKVKRGAVGPGTGKGKPCRDGYDRGHV